MKVKRFVSLSWNSIHKLKQTRANKEKDQVRMNQLRRQCISLLHSVNDKIRFQKKAPEMTEKENQRSQRYLVASKFNLAIG